MSEQFQLPNGTIVGTGMLPTPDNQMNLCAEYPESELYEFDEALELIKQANRIPRRKLFAWILNQKQTNQCNAFAATASGMKKRVLSGQTHVDLSPASIYIKICGGVDQGSTLPDGMLAAEKYGWAMKSQVQEGAFKERDLSQEARQTAYRRFRALKTYQLPRNQGVVHLWRALITAILRDDIPVLAVHVGRSYMQGADSNGICYYDRGPGNHAVHADDVKILGNPRSFVDLFVDKVGSWGYEWGDNGRALITPRHIEETMMNHPIYAYREMLVDPDGNYPSLGDFE